MPIIIKDEKEDLDVEVHKGGLDIPGPTAESLEDEAQRLFDEASAGLKKDFPGLKFNKNKRFKDVESFSLGGGGSKFKDVKPFTLGAINPAGLPKEPEPEAPAAEEGGFMEAVRAIPPGIEAGGKLMKKAWHGALLEDIEEQTDEGVDLNEMSASDLAFIPPAAQQKMAKSNVPKARRAEIAKEELARIAVIDAEIQGLRPKSKAFWTNATFDAAQSVSFMTPALAAGIIGRSPNALMAMGGMTYYNSYGEHRSRGADPQTAARLAGVDGITEVVTEMAPTKFLFGAGGIVRKTLTTLLADIPGEQVANVVQSVTADLAGVPPDATQEQVNQLIIDSAARAAAQWKEVAATTVLAGGAQAGAVRGTELAIGALTGAKRENGPPEEPPEATSPPTPAPGIPPPAPPGGGAAPTVTGTTTTPPVPGAGPNIPTVGQPAVFKPNSGPGYAVVVQSVNPESGMATVTRTDKNGDVVLTPDGEPATFQTPIADLESFGAPAAPAAPAIPPPPPPGGGAAAPAAVNPPSDTSVEPIKDLDAQIKDMRNHKTPRRGVYISPPTVAMLKEAGQYEGFLARGEAEENFDGQGGVLLARSKKDLDEARFARDSGMVDMQQIIGKMTGAGIAKPKVAKPAVVQRKDETGATVQETAVEPERAAPVAAVMAELPGTVEVTTPEAAIAARNAQVAKERLKPGDVFGAADYGILFALTTLDTPKEGNITKTDVRSSAQAVGAAAQMLRIAAVEAQARGAPPEVISPIISKDPKQYGIATRWERIGDKGELDFVKARGVSEPKLREALQLIQNAMETLAPYRNAPKVVVAPKAEAVKKGKKAKADKGKATEADKITAAVLADPVIEAGVKEDSAKSREKILAPVTAAEEAARAEMKPEVRAAVENFEKVRAADQERRKAETDRRKAQEPYSGADRRVGGKRRDKKPDIDELTGLEVERYNQIPEQWVVQSKDGTKAHSIHDSKASAEAWVKWRKMEGETDIVRLPPSQSPVYKAAGPIEIIAVSVLDSLPRRNDTAKGTQHYRDLKADIKKHGMKSPIVVAIAGQGKPPRIYEGNHRLAIAKELGLETVPVVLHYESSFGSDPSGVGVSTVLPAKSQVGPTGMTVAPPGERVVHRKKKYVPPKKQTDEQVAEKVAEATAPKPIETIELVPSAVAEQGEAFIAELLGAAPEEIQQEVALDKSGKMYNVLKAMIDAMGNRDSWAGWFAAVTRSGVMPREHRNQMFGLIREYAAAERTELQGVRERLLANLTNINGKTLEEPAINGVFEAANLARAYTTLAIAVRDAAELPLDAQAEIGDVDKDLDTNLAEITTATGKTEMDAALLNKETGTLSTARENEIGGTAREKPRFEGPPAQPSSQIPAEYRRPGEYFFHQVFYEDSSLEGIFRNGLNVGTNVSLIDGQGTELAEGGLILVFKHTPGEITSKGYQDDYLVSRSGLKPVAIIKDTSIDERTGTTQDAEFDRLNKDAEAIYGALDKFADNWFMDRAAVVDAATLWPSAQTKAFMEKFVPRKKEAFEALARKLNALSDRADRVSRMPPTVATVTRSDVLKRYQRFGVPVHAALEPRFEGPPYEEFVEMLDFKVNQSRLNRHIHDLWKAVKGPIVEKLTMARRRTNRALTSEEAIDFILSTGSSLPGARNNPFLRLLQRMKPLMPNVRVEFYRPDEKVLDSRGKVIPFVSGIFIPDEGRILMRLQETPHGGVRFSAFNLQTLVHEMVHAATTYYIHAHPNSPIARRLEVLRLEILGKARNKFGAAVVNTAIKEMDAAAEKGLGIEALSSTSADLTSYLYGLRNIDEMVAESFTRMGFQSFLNSLDDTPKKSWFRRVRDRLGKLYNEALGNKNPAEGRLLGEILFLGVRAMETQAGLASRQRRAVRKISDALEEMLRLDIPLAVNIAFQAVHGWGVNHQQLAKLAKEGIRSEKALTELINQVEPRADIENLQKQNLISAYSRIPGKAITGKANVYRLYPPRSAGPPPMKHRSKVARLTTPRLATAVAGVNRLMRSRFVSGARDKGLGLLSTDFIVSRGARLFGNVLDATNPLVAWKRLRDTRRSYSNQLLELADKTVNSLWMKLSPHRSQQLGDVLQETTLWQIDPTQGISQPKLMGSVGKQAWETKVHEINGLWKALDSEQKELYQAVQKYFQHEYAKIRRAGVDLAVELFGGSLTDVQRTLLYAIRNVDHIENVVGIGKPIDLSEGNDKFKKILRDLIRVSSIKGPYFPLMRKGDRVVEVAREGILNDADGRPQTFDTKAQAQAVADSIRLRAPKNTAKVVAHGTKFQVHHKIRHVSFHTSENDAREAILELQQQGFDVVNGVFTRKLEKVDSANLTEGLKELMSKAQSVAAAGAKDVPEEQKAITDTLQAAFMQILAERAASASSQLKRQGVAGFKGREAHEIFARRVRATSWHYANLKTAMAQSKLLTRLRTFSRDVSQGGSPPNMTPQELINARGRTMMEVTNRLRVEADEQASLTRNNLDMVLGQLGYINFLLTPSYAFVNAMQNFNVAMPYVAAKFGRKGAKAMLHAMKVVSGPTFAKAMRGVTSKPGNVSVYDVYTAIAKAVGESPRFARFTEARGDQPSALQELVDMGIINASFIQEMSAIANNQSLTATRGMEYIRMLPQSIELWNRITTALAVLEATNGNTEAAAETVRLTHIDYSIENRPRYFRQIGTWRGIPQAITMFKMYGVSMWQLGASLIVDAVSRRGQSKETRARAATALAGIISAHALSVGVLGSVMLEPLRLLMQVWNSFGDDDEFKDLDTSVQNWAAEVTGSDEGGRLLSRGLWNALGFDLSGRMGLDRLLMYDTPEEFTENEGWKMLGQLLGPIPAMVIKKIGRINALVEQGRPYEAIMEAVPVRQFQDARKAWELQTHGVRSASGATVIEADQFNWVDSVGRFAGFQTTEEAHASDQASTTYSYKTWKKARVRELSYAYWNAYDAGDEAAKQAAIIAIKRFNQKNPGAPVTGESLIASRRGAESAVRERTGQGRNRDLNQLLDY